MPLTSGIARGVRKLRTLLASRIDHESAADWLVETYHLSATNAQAIVEFFSAQTSVSEIPVGRKMLIELYRTDDYSHYFFHSLIGRSAKKSASWLVVMSPYITRGVAPV